jgi:muramidase (phage lysozyme)
VAKIDQLDAALESPKVRAFLAAIRYCEGTADAGGYSRLFGGGKFSSYAQHPNVPVTFKLKGKAYTSTAAGAYQFLNRTWVGLVRQYGFEDFSPKNQDRGAVALILGRRALDDVLNGNIRDAIAKCNKEWASLPGSPYGQPVKTMPEVLAVYQRELDAILSESGSSPEPEPIQVEEPPPTATPVPAPVPVTAPEKKGSILSPFVIPALNAIIEIFPKLAKVFKPDSAVAERNVAAAEIVVNAAKEAIGARNEQELIETIKEASPEDIKTIQEAVKSVWHEIELDTSGIAAARSAAAAVDQLPFWRNGAFVITVLFIPLIYLTVWWVLKAESTLSDEVKAMVVASIVSGLLTGIVGFWLGTSFSSQRKTEIAAATAKP